MKTKQLPTGWKEVELEIITECLDNKRIPITGSDRKKGNIPYYGANGQVDSTDDFIFDEELLLLAEDGGSWGHNQKCSYIINGKSWVNNHAHVLRVDKKKVEIKFLMYWFNLTDLNKYISGTTRGKLNQKIMKSIKIPLPPLATQKKIVQILEQAENLKQRRQQADKLTDEYLKSVFNKMFGDPVKNEKRWDFKKIKDIANVKGRVGWKGYKKSDLRNSGPLVLGATHITKGGFIDLSKPVYLSREKFEESPEIKIEKYDLIFSQRGTLGLTGLITFKIGEATINPCVLIIQPFEINSFYFNALLNFDTIRNKIIELGRTTSIPMITQKDIKSFKIPLPPLPLQQKFASIVEKVEKIKENQKQSKQEIDDLFNALMQKAFKGGLV